MKTPETVPDLKNLTLLNDTELRYLIRRQTGLVLKRSVTKERLIELMSGDEWQTPHPDEVSPSTETRRQLQVYIEKNWSGISSQLPCKGENRGRCTIYPCPEGRHVDCLLSATPHMVQHKL